MPKFSVITTERHGASCTRLNKTAATSCSTSTFRAPHRSSINFPTPPASSSCPPTAGRSKSACASAVKIEKNDRYNYILVNDQLEDSIKALRAIVRGERLVRAGQPLSPEETKTVALADRCRLANVRDRLKPILTSFKPPGDSGKG